MLSCQRLFIPNKRFVWISFTPTSVSPISGCLRYICHTPRASVRPIQAISCVHRSLNSPPGNSAPMVTPLRKRTDGMQIDSTIRDGASPKRSTIISKNPDSIWIDRKEESRQAIQWCPSGACQSEQAPNRATVDIEVLSDRQCHDRIKPIDHHTATPALQLTLIFPLAIPGDVFAGLC